MQQQHQPLSQRVTSGVNVRDYRSISREVVWAILLFMIGGLLLGTHTARADHNSNGDWSKTAWNDEHVIVFSDCNFSGLSKAIPPGDYQAMRRIGVDQNAVSSILIPNGLAVEIFQKAQFGGHWYRLNQSQSCLKGNWNDRIGSIRVVPDDIENSFGFSSGYGNEGNNCFPFEVTARRGDGAFRLVDSERRLTDIPNRRSIDGEVCDKDTVRVELAKRDQAADVRLQIAGQEYRFGPNDAYDDFRRDYYRQYYTIELPRNSGGGDDMEYGRGKWGNTDGFGPRYSSGVGSGENWGNSYAGNWYRSGRNKPVNTNTAGNSGGASNNNQCASYRVIGNHSDTGFRFLTGDQQFYRITNGAVNGDLCQVGAVRIELAKKNVGSTVVMQIGGESYAFRGNDDGDAFRNGWYRKYITINVR